MVRALSGDSSVSMVLSVIKGALGGESSVSMVYSVIKGALGRVEGWGNLLRGLYQK